MFDPLQRRLAQNEDLISQFTQHLKKYFLDPLRIDSHALRVGDDFRQRDQTDIGPPIRRLAPFRMVRQLLDPRHDADGDGLAALGAQPFVFDRFSRMQTELTIAVTVVMILPLFRKEFDRADEPFVAAVGQGPVNPRIRKLRVINRRLPSQFWRRMRVGIGNQDEPVELTQPPVHQGIRRQPRLDGKNVAAQIAEAIVHPVKPALGSHRRKPRRPDMRRDQITQRVRLEDNLQQGPANPAPGWPAVGRNVPRSPASPDFAAPQTRRKITLCTLPYRLFINVEISQEHKPHLVPGRVRTRFESARRGAA